MSARGCLGPAGSLLSAVDAVIRKKGDQFRQGAVLAQQVLLRTKQGAKGGWSESFYPVWQVSHATSTLSQGQGKGHSALLIALGTSDNQSISHLKMKISTCLPVV